MSSPSSDSEDVETEVGVHGVRAFRLVNRLHRRTRDGVILHQLLFKPGDRYSRRVLAESERVLRADRDLRAAEIRPVSYDGHTVDIEVDTEDTWTTRAGFGVGRSDGSFRQVELGRPFYSLDSRWAAGLSGSPAIARSLIRGSPTTWWRMRTSRRTTRTR